MPDVDFARYRAVWRRDNATGKCRRAGARRRGGAALLDRLGRTPPPLADAGARRAALVDSDDEYRRRVERVLEYLRAGDCYQVNLSHRLHATLGEYDALPLYLRLRALAPAPLGAYLASGGRRSCATRRSSFLRVRPGLRRDAADQGHAAARRRRRTRTRGWPRSCAASAKDAAEHLMIVDLLRNDLGRVARDRLGGGRRLRAPGDAADGAPPGVDGAGAGRGSGCRSRRSCARPCRAGRSPARPSCARSRSSTSSRATRARALLRRHRLAGAGAARRDLALAIRTAVVRGGELALGVGGGIVADSDPDDELAETRVKAEAFLRAMSRLQRLDGIQRRRRTSVSRRDGAGADRAA